MQSKDPIPSFLSLEERQGHTVFLSTGLFVSFDGSRIAYDDLEALIAQGLVSRRIEYVEHELMGPARLPRCFYRLTPEPPPCDA